MQSNLSRRNFLRAAAAAGVAVVVVQNSMVFGVEPSGGCRYQFRNKTKGRWADDQCFWSIDNGTSWHSFKDESSTPCPTGNGRLYIRLGAAPKNFDDRRAYWDFIEYAYSNGVWNGNTTQVDGFCIPITVAMGNHKVGINGGRSKMFEKFLADCPPAFRDCVKGDYWILSPGRAGFGKGGPHADYFQKYIDQIWQQYTDGKTTPSGKYSGKVNGDALTFTPTGGGQTFTCTGKPNTQDVLLGQGMLATNAPFCAAFNRHVAADPADWHAASSFYQAQPCNWYSKFLHEHAIDQKCYGFCYDDVAEQAAYFSAKGNELVVTVNWD